MTSSGLRQEMHGGWNVEASRVLPQGAKTLVGVGDSSFRSPRIGFTSTISLLATQYQSF